MGFAILICSLFTACLGAAVGYAIGFYKHNKGHGVNIPDVEVEVPMPEVEPPKEGEPSKEEDELPLRSASYYRKLAKEADKNGTSDKMIRMIAERVQLPIPNESMPHSQNPITSKKQYKTKYSRSRCCGEKHTKSNRINPKYGFLQPLIRYFSLFLPLAPQKKGNH